MCLKSTSEEKFSNKATKLKNKGDNSYLHYLQWLREQYSELMGFFGGSDVKHLPAMGSS